MNNIKSRLILVTTIRALSVGLSQALASTLADNPSVSVTSESVSEKSAFSSFDLTVTEAVSSSVVFIDTSGHVAYTVKQLPNKPLSTVVYTDGLFTANLKAGAFINASHTKEVGWRRYQLV